MIDFSVIIIVKGRRKQLANTIEAIERSTILPKDIQVVVMDTSDDVMAGKKVPTYVTVVNGSDMLPLAKARNTGATQAQTDMLVFIDVDCIVSPTLFERTVPVCTNTTVITGYPKYLSIVPTHGDYNKLEPSAIDHPSRYAIPTDKKVSHLKFWSLMFCISKQAFENIDGFDEEYTGYGGEDTDFAMRFNAKNIDLVFIKDYVLHQYHTKYDPPLNYIEDILKNAETFRLKWGFLPMMAWLEKFYELGFINNPNTAKQLLLQKHPTSKEIEAALSRDPY